MKLLRRRTKGAINLNNCDNKLEGEGHVVYSDVTWINKPQQRRIRAVQAQKEKAWTQDKMRRWNREEWLTL